MTTPSDGQAFWERTAARYDRSMTLLGGPIPAAVAGVVELVAGSARVLEVASGTGLFTAAMAPVVGELIATDYAAAMVAQTQARVAGRGAVRCLVRDLYALGEDIGPVDAVVGANLLHLLPDLPGGLQALRRVLRPGGLLLVPTYCHAQSPTARAVSTVLSWVSLPAHRRFDLDGLSGAVASAGFEIERETLLDGLLPIGFVTGRRV